ncbi:neutral zinc metallopeptidase [Nocardia sp. XZ_19_385]|uniref:neutral zinc metallopeptidase n=1 Tax=Nocardia sp. XZ_19_385 TaxID=2769488 RepID=UPI00188DDD1F|nr:neutral zinc metallopeptidase [Nocardia sp. XZ_19_385]
MNQPLTSRQPPRNSGRGLPVTAICGAIAIIAMVGFVVAAGWPAGAPRPADRAGAIAMGAGLAFGPGFTGAPSDPAKPAGYSAAPVDPVRLSGAAQFPSSRQVYALADHPLFAQHVGLTKVDCTLPGWGADAESARAFYVAAIDCLDAAWEPTLRGAGLPFRSPRVAVPAQAGTRSSPCGQEEGDTAESFYCTLDETIILPFDGLRSVTTGSRRGAQLAALAHEYGHHIQSLIGVMRAYLDKRTGLGWDSGPGQEQSRRLDLQAACFAGMFLGRNYGRADLDQQTWDEAVRVTRVAGDRPGYARLHGTDFNVWGWWKWGADLGDTAECNTWYSAAPYVA